MCLPDSRAVPSSATRGISCPPSPYCVLGTVLGAYGCGPVQSLEQVVHLGAKARRQVQVQWQRATLKSSLVHTPGVQVAAWIAPVLIRSFCFAFLLPCITHFSLHWGTAGKVGVKAGEKLGRGKEGGS